MATSTSRIFVALFEAASLFATALKKKVSRGGPGGFPAEIGKGISVGNPSGDQDTAYIDVYVRAAMARAFEYGSGVRSEKGARDRYVIEPRNKKVLAFYWDEAANLNPIIIGMQGSITVTPGEKVFLPSVRHPGIAPRPYIRPTLKEQETNIKQRLAGGFTAMVMAGEQPITIIEVGRRGK